MPGFGSIFDPERADPYAGALEQRRQVQEMMDSQDRAREQFAFYQDAEKAMRENEAWVEKYRRRKLLLLAG